MTLPFNQLCGLSDFCRIECREQGKIIFALPQQIMIFNLECYESANCEILMTFGSDEINRS